TMTPVVGPIALRKTGPLGLVTTMSAPPCVWICMTLGATFLAASLQAFSIISLRSACAAAVPAEPRNSATVHTYRRCMAGILSVVVSCQLSVVRRDRRLL